MSEPAPTSLLPLEELLEAEDPEQYRFADVEALLNEQKGNRDKRVYIRVSEDERTLLDRLAELSAYASRAHFLRRRIFGAPVEWKADLNTQAFARKVAARLRSLLEEAGEGAGDAAIPPSVREVLEELAEDAGREFDFLTRRMEEGYQPLALDLDLEEDSENESGEASASEDG